MPLPFLFLWSCSAPAPEPAPEPPPRTLRPLTKSAPAGDPRVAMTQAMTLDLKQSEVEDLWPDRAYRVDLFAGAEGQPSRGQLDLDRDGRWDQEWRRAEAGLQYRALVEDGSWSDWATWEGAALSGSAILESSSPKREKPK